MQAAGEKFLCNFFGSPDKVSQTSLPRFRMDAIVGGVAISYQSAFEIRSENDWATSVDRCRSIWKNARAVFPAYHAKWPVPSFRHEVSSA